MTAKKMDWPETFLEVGLPELSADGGIRDISSFYERKSSAGREIAQAQLWAMHSETHGKPYADRARYRFVDASFECQCSCTQGTGRINRNLLTMPRMAAGGLGTP